MDEHTTESGPGDPSIAALNVGNSNAMIGLCKGGKAASVSRHPVDDTGSLVRAIDGLDVDAIAVASVNDSAAAKIAEAVEKAGGPRLYFVGKDLDIPIRHSLSDDAIVRTGTDRLLAALGAFETVRQACVVVDAGTAVTVDFIDGEGVFHGGAIAPGASLQLRSLAEGTDALPLLIPEVPEGPGIGTDTIGAMQRGVHYGIRGMVRMLVEQYAQEYAGYPLVLATGGDAPMLFGEDELVDRVAMDLVLIGIARCCAEAMGESEPLEPGRLNGRSDA